MQLVSAFGGWFGWPGLVFQPEEPRLSG